MSDEKDISSQIHEYPVLVVNSWGPLERKNNPSEAFAIRD